MTQLTEEIFYSGTYVIISSFDVYYSSLLLLNHKANNNYLKSNNEKGYIGL